MLDYDGDLDRIISSAQKDQFVNAIRAYPRPQTTHYYHYPEMPSLNLFSSRLEEIPLGSRGCERFIDFILEFTFSKNRSVLPGVYHEALLDVQGKSLVQYLLGDRACRPYVESLNRSLVSSWITKEFLWQFSINFQSSKFLRFLQSLNQGASFEYGISKKAQQSPADAYLSNMNVDPGLLVVLKAFCFTNAQEFRSWLEFSELITSKKIEKKRFSYSIKERASKECTHGNYCGAGTYEAEDLDYLASYFTPKIYRDLVGLDKRSYAWDLHQYLNSGLFESDFTALGDAICSSGGVND